MGGEHIGSNLGQSEPHLTCLLALLSGEGVNTQIIFSWFDLFLS